jgi:hypothetical protein
MRMIRGINLVSYQREKNMTFTNHSTIRCQQRGVSKDVVEFICKHGKKVNTHGDHKYFINKKALNNLMIKERGFISKNDKQILSTAVVCKNDVIITVMKITTKIVWH